jgi:hypothetical protein
MFRARRHTLRSLDFKSVCLERFGSMSALTVPVFSETSALRFAASDDIASMVTSEFSETCIAAPLTTTITAVPSLPVRTREPIGISAPAVSG